MFGKHMITLSVDQILEPIDLKIIPEPYALNNVRSLRNLDWLIDIWMNKI